MPGGGIFSLDYYVTRERGTPHQSRCARQLPLGGEAKV